MELYEMYASLGVSRAVWEYGERVLEGLQDRFAAIDRTAEYNQAKERSIKWILPKMRREIDSTKRQIREILRLFQLS